MKEKLIETIGRYEIKKSLAKGGMGEVFYAFDPKMGRYVALKIIREDLLKYAKIRKRFLKEAQIAGKLTHPSIIPIYSIHQDQDKHYYTMPYVEGETLKQIILKTKEYEEKGEGKPHPQGVSIPALIRIFLNVCQAVSYAHSKEIIHRDLKPENIIVGKFGEVLILDWGIAVYKGEADNTLTEIESEPTFPDLTQPGKVLGTLSYLAPERAHGEEASETSDVYSLGVILYLLLTLELPFARSSIKQFRKTMIHETLIEPSERAPYREIPRQLSEITKKALSFDHKDRYESVKSLITDVEHYIEGNPEWIFAKSFSLDRKEDWEFQENIILAKHMAITRSSKMMEWALLMISKDRFSGNTKIQLEITLQEGAEGIGILLSVPESKERESIEDGYRFWIGSKENPSLKLYRSNVEVMHLADVGLKPGVTYEIMIEKIENHVRFYLNQNLLLNYVSYIPLVGAHIGLIYKDTFFSIQSFNIYEGSQNVMVNCLSIPDAFLVNKHFQKALSEYRRISYSFQGRAEGREALFRAGITLIEKARSEKRETKKRAYLLEALDEFEKLRASPGAPLEYLGKSIVYKEHDEVEEEIKCLELAFRKYPRHPLEHILEEHVIFRLHQTASNDRIGAYHFALLALRLIPHIFALEDTRTLLINLQKFAEPLFFIQTPSEFSSPKAHFLHLAIELCFWLGKPLILLDIYEKKISPFPERNLFVRNILSIFVALGLKKFAHIVLNREKENGFYEPSSDLSLVERMDQKWISSLPENPSEFTWHLYQCLIYHSLTIKSSAKLLPLFEKLDKLHMPSLIKETFDALHIWALLLCKKTKAIPTILDKYHLETLQPSLLFLMYGLYLWSTEGKEISTIHFEDLQDTSFPYSFELLPHYLRGKIKLKKGWGKKAFLWEKISLCKQLSLLHHINEEPNRAKYFEKKARELFKRHSQSL